MWNETIFDENHDDNYLSIIFVVIIVDTISVEQHYAVKTSSNYKSNNC